MRNGRFWLTLPPAEAAEQDNRVTARDNNINEHAFAEPIVAAEVASEPESQDLEAILEGTRAKVGQAQPGDKLKTAARARQEEIAALEAFVASHRGTAWTPSVQANLGQYHRQQGRFTLALQHWEAAWQATKHHRNGQGKRVADYVLAHWTRLLASLGRTESLAALFQENRGRELDQGPLSQKWARTREAFRQMQRRPGLSYQCGTFALEAVGKTGRRTMRWCCWSALSGLASR